MTIFEAKAITNKGLRFAIAGGVIGLLVSINFGLVAVGALAYAFWALFHGIQIMQPLVRNLYNFGPVKLEVHSISELFAKSSQLKLIRLALLIIGGYFLGMLGGAIIRQLYLLIIILR